MLSFPPHTKLTTSSVSPWTVWAPPHLHTSFLSQLEASEGQASDSSLTLLCSAQMEAGEMTQSSHTFLAE